MKIYHLECSVNEEGQSLTRKYSRFLIQRLLMKDNQSTVDYIDLTKEHIPYINKEYELAMFKPAEKRTKEDWEAIGSFNIKPFLESDIYVLAVPGYFFNVPAVFKNWLEHLFLFDVTITRNWEGLLKNKKMYIISAWGGTYTNTTIEHSFEHVIAKSFGLFGITDITFFNIYVDKETKTNNIKEIEQSIIESI